MSKSEEAKMFFTNGCNCCQAVLLAFARECGLEQEQALKLASGFGGGIGRMREVCGAFSGAVMVADLLVGPGSEGDKAAKDAHYALIQELAAAFKAETGSLICREMLGLTPAQNASPESTPRTPEFYKKRPCADIVALAAELAGKRFMNND